MKSLILFLFITASAFAQNADDRASGKTQTVQPSSPSIPAELIGTWYEIGANCVKADGKIIHSERFPEHRSILVLQEGTFLIEGTILQENCLLRNSGQVWPDTLSSTNLRFRATESTVCKNSKGQTVFLRMGTFSPKIEMKVRQPLLHVMYDESCEHLGDKGHIETIYDPSSGS